MPRDKLYGNVFTIFAIACLFRSGGGAARSWGDAEVLLPFFGGRAQDDERPDAIPAALMNDHVNTLFF